MMRLRSTGTTRDPEELIVKRARPNKFLPIHDYRPALQCAVSWLGDRYLLAAPVTRRREESRPYFAENRRWFPTRH